MQWVKGMMIQNGKYVIEDVLGQGGFGTTYKARHTAVNQSVAIKTPNAFLKHDPDYPKYIKSFVKEAKRVARMGQEPHPNLVRFTDYFLEGEIPCLVMEFVAGETLFEVVRKRGALPETKVVRLLEEIGGALQWMHDRNLIHRDVNPANIMVHEDGRAVLIDLGIAQEISPVTQTSTNMSGNQDFAPYEQLVKGSRHVRCDIYSLSATAYFMVTGKRPRGSLQRKIIREPLQEPAAWDVLNQAIIWGMSLEIGERPHNITEWLSGLSIKDTDVRKSEEKAFHSINFCPRSNRVKTFLLALFFTIFALYAFSTESLVGMLNNVIVSIYGSGSESKGLTGNINTETTSHTVRNARFECLTDGLIYSTQVMSENTQGFQKIIVYSQEGQPMEACREVTGKLNFSNSEDELAYI